jgi:hypothetical protein
MPKILKDNCSKLALRRACVELGLKSNLPTIRALLESIGAFAARHLAAADPGKPCEEQVVSVGADSCKAGRIALCPFRRRRPYASEWEEAKELDEVWSESEERLELGEEMDVSAPQDNSEIEYLEDVIEWEVEMRKDYEVSSSASDDSSDSEVSASESEASSAGGVFEDSAPENDCACDKVGPSGAGPNMKGWCNYFFFCATSRWLSRPKRRFATSPPFRKEAQDDRGRQEVRGYVRAS